MAIISLSGRENECFMNSEDCRNQFSNLVALNC